MDKETLSKMGGTVSWIEVPYTTTKLSVETGKNRWQTAGGDTIIARVEVGSEADPQAVFNATREWLKQLAVDANKATLAKLNTAYKAYHQPVLRDASKKETRTMAGGMKMNPTPKKVVPGQETGTFEPTPPVAKKAPPKKAATTEAVKPAQPQDGTVPGDLTFVVETLSVEVKGGKRYVKAKGGSFVKFGVNVWPEVLALPPLEWVADELDGADYPAPAGLTAVYSEKTLDSGKVVPDKVTGWK